MGEENNEVPKMVKTFPVKGLSQKAKWSGSSGQRQIPHLPLLVRVGGKNEAAEGAKKGRDFQLVKSLWTWKTTADDIDLRAPLSGVPKTLTGIAGGGVHKGCSEEETLRMKSKLIPRKHRGGPPKGQRTAKQECGRRRNSGPKKLWRLIFA